MKNAKKLLMNTLLLTAASFILQTVNVSYNVWLTNKIGAAGIGLFQLIMTVYGLGVTLGCGGIRLAATRMSVEAQALGKSSRQIMRKCMRYALFTGCVIAFVMLIGADLIASKWLADTRSTSPLRVLALAIPFVAVSSSLNGYFTAMRKIAKYSCVRMAEQGVRIAIVAFLLGRLLPHGTEYGCIAIVAGILFSELFSFICLRVLYISDVRGNKAGSEKEHGIVREICRIAVPDVAGAGMRSVLLTIEHLLIPSGFRKSGSSPEQALTVYGNIHGMVFPLLLYPSAILSSLSGLLVPELAQYRARGMNGQISYIIERVMKITLIFSVGTAGIMYAFADGLSLLIYSDSHPAFYIRLLAPLIPVMYCDMTVDGILKGLDQQFYSMKYNIIDSALCVALVYILLPKYSVKGYIFVLFASEMINFFLSIRRLIVVSTVSIDVMKELVMPVCCVLCAVCAVSVAATLTGIAAAFTAVTLTVCILLAVLIYFALMYFFGCVTREDVQWFLSVIDLQPRKGSTPAAKKPARSALSSVSF